MLSAHDVRDLLPMRECIDVMSETLMALSRQQVIQPLRSIMWLPERVGALGAMPGYLSHIGMMGIKVVSVFPGNHGTAFDSHQGAVLLFETTHGELVAAVDATAITAIRTAAVSGVATRTLARANAKRLTILGAGTQASSHVAAMLAVRPIDHVTVWSRDAAHAAAFAERESAHHAVPVAVAHDVHAAVRGADVICTTTASVEPILRGEWLEPGVHINAVGSSVSVARELDSAAIVRSRLFVDRRESALNEAGDILFPLREGAIRADHILAELGDVLCGATIGRATDSDITLFKSLGLAIEDVASAHHVYARACERGVGIAVELGGRREGSATA